MQSVEMKPTKPTSSEHLAARAVLKVECFERDKPSWLDIVFQKKHLCPSVCLCDALQLKFMPLLFSVQIYCSKLCKLHSVGLFFVRESFMGNYFQKTDCCWQKVKNTIATAAIATVDPQQLCKVPFIHSFIHSRIILLAVKLCVD
ncbi:hypothetical protein T06_11033 [Trichinella sp. T6]|nr:hypothetical protein T06_11033 [Trichinella sp. T6]